MDPCSISDHRATFQKEGQDFGMMGLNCDCRWETGATGYA